MNEVIIPIVEKIRLSDPKEKYIKILKHHLENITTSFGKKITHINPRLTHREIEICTLIENGLTSKEISSLLNITCETVNKHRTNIRKKLNITHIEKNLRSSLEML